MIYSNFSQELGKALQDPALDAIRLFQNLLQKKLFSKLKGELIRTLIKGVLIFRSLISSGERLERRNCKVGNQVY